MPIRTLTVIGTRPEAIKMAPVLALLKSDDRFESRLCLSGQHRDMVSPILDLFDLHPDHDLAVMKPGQTLSELAAKILTGLSPILAFENPDWLLVHGDTSTTSSAALAAFYNDISLGHVEAGLRTHDLRSPWPEEMNRRLTSLVTQRHFAPTKAARKNLVLEGVPPDTIIVTGNTVVDAALAARAKLESDVRMKERLRLGLPTLDPSRKLIIVTAHRRENHDGGIVDICRAVRQLVLRHHAQCVFPVHLNPTVRQIVRSELEGVANVHLTDPLDYLEFVFLMTQAYLAVTDSGGIQEEAPSFDLPILITRDTTERPEVIEAGAGQLVGTDSQAIFEAASNLLDSQDAHKAMANALNPYGDGQAAQRIVESLVISP